jgi:hypothetical protein
MQLANNTYILIKMFWKSDEDFVLKEMHSSFDNLNSDYFKKENVP